MLSESIPSESVCYLNLFYLNLYAIWICMLSEYVCYLKLHAIWICMLSETACFLNLYAIWICMLSESVYYESVSYLKLCYSHASVAVNYHITTHDVRGGGEGEAQQACWHRPNVVNRSPGVARSHYIMHRRSRLGWASQCIATFSPIDILIQHICANCKESF